MLLMLMLAHILGDYILQFDALARWKSRSVWGVVAHGGIVTLATLVCAALVDPGWWPNALLIGATHTAIDVVRARLIRTKSTFWDMVWYLLDQVTHFTVIALIVAHSGASLLPVAGRHNARMLPLSYTQTIALVLGYMALLQPSWVLLRFIVRGLWGAEAAPHLGAGEKFAPMVERVCIATCALTGQLYLIPVVLLPRRLTPIQVQGNGMIIMLRLTTHWAETLLGAALATGVGLALRMVLLAG